jgi:hypothetical protein
MTEQELLVDCLQRLNKVGAAYMLTGSMASNYWGIPRTTHDLAFVLQLPRTSIPTLRWASQLGVRHRLDDLFAGRVRPKTT